MLCGHIKTFNIIVLDLSRNNSFAKKEVKRIVKSENVTWSQGLLTLPSIYCFFFFLFIFLQRGNSSCHRGLGIFLPTRE